MVDNVGYTPGAGATIATDEVTTLNGGAVSAVQVQRVKVTYGADGLATDVSSTTPLPITALSFEDLLGQMLIELKVISTLLQVGLTISDDPGLIRDDFARSLN